MEMTGNRDKLSKPPGPLQGSDSSHRWITMNLQGSGSNTEAHASMSPCQIGSNRLLPSRTINAHIYNCCLLFPFNFTVIIILFVI